MVGWVGWVVMGFGGGDSGLEFLFSFFWFLLKGALTGGGGREMGCCGFGRW